MVKATGPWVGSRGEKERKTGVRVQSANAKRACEQWDWRDQ